jgi:hypothetical protein
VTTHAGGQALPFAGAVSPLPGGRLAENVVHFVRVLRSAGLPVGPAHTVAALEAISVVGLDRRDDFRTALSAVLVSREDHLPLFEQAFDLYWRHPRALERLVASMLPSADGRGEPADSPPEVPARLAQALLPPGQDAAPDSGGDPAGLDAAFTCSAREVLQRKDFESMTVDELAAARRVLAALRLPLPEVATRRSRPSARGHRVDLRATLRRATGAAGALTPLRFRSRVRRTPPLVVLCDISGSMDRYARMLLHFLHAITNDRDRVHVLLFGTRLTNITRHLKHRDVDVALARVTAAVADWAGGTRIGGCLDEFNRRWARRLLGQNAVVLLISDGLDAEGGAGLDEAMERLEKSCRRLVWLNPLLRYEGFEARPAGIRAMLPHVDDFLPVHNLASLADLARTLARPPSQVRGARARAGTAGTIDPPSRRQEPPSWK